MIRMINDERPVFFLGTPGTTYIFRVTETGQLEHLYYGGDLYDLAKVGDARLLADAEAMTEKRVFSAGNMISYDKEHLNVTLEDMRMEMSGLGKGDIREPFVEIEHADGSITSDFVFDHAEISDTKPAYRTLPGSVSEDGRCGHLCVFLKDRSYDLTLELHYYVYEDCDVICRSSRLVNTSKEAVRLHRLMSAQLDFEEDNAVVTTFSGAWAREMNQRSIRVKSGKFENSSYTGSSSNRSNPFIMVHRKDTGERSGIGYGFNLIYSGNHYESVEVNAFGKTRVLVGINPRSFCFLLEPGEDFEAPEAVMTFFGKGFAQLSSRMHSFVREHIVRGEWKKKVRPVLLNSWEAAYFKFDEAKLLRLAKAGKEAGIELFVMDDGWFGERDSDDRSLGDWTENRKKLPGGLAGICRKINDLGMDFGIWVEPEMVNVNSDLYRAHSDWSMEIPGKPHSEGRNQRILDLANPAVADYIIAEMERVFSSAPIAYVKWDMNRIMSDVYSQYLPAERQGETAHRYIIGLYRIMKTLTEKFPHILFEGCAAGGNRFDLGILCYFPQIWASDDTDACQRVTIQEGYSYGYPMSCVAAHVSSCPNHQTLRETPMDTRFNVAAFGVCGYELNLADLSRKELETVKKQIATYKQWREVLQFGSFYRGRKENIHEWTCVSPDKTKAVGLLFQQMADPNSPFEQFRAKGLDPDRVYHMYNEEQRRNIRNFGDLINTAAPIHVKQDSQLHYLLSRFVTMPGEREEFTVSGSVIMRAGIKLAQAYGGTGYNEHTRYFQDFSSRLYFFEAVSETDET